MLVFLVFMHRPGQDVFAADLMGVFADESDASAAAEEWSGWVEEKTVTPKQRTW